MLRKKAYLLNTHTHTHILCLPACCHYTTYSSLFCNTFIFCFICLEHSSHRTLSMHIIFPLRGTGVFDECYLSVLSSRIHIAITMLLLPSSSYIYIFLSQFTGIFFIIVLPLKKIKAFESRTTADSLYLISSRHLFGQWFWSIFINNDILIIYHIPHTHLFRVSRPNYEM